jgi:hypothetical protein
MSIVAACSEGGRVEVNGGGAIVTKSGARTASGRGRRQRAPRPRSRRWRAPRLGMRQRCALGPGSMTVGGDSTDGR